MRQVTFARSTVLRFLALGLIPLVSLALIGGAKLAEVQLDAAGWRAEKNAETVSAQVRSFLSNPEVTLQELGHVANNADAARALSDSIVNHFPAIESIEILDGSGIVDSASIRPDISAHPNDLLGQDHSRDPLFLRSIITSVPVWSGVFTSPVSGNRALGVAVRFERGVVMGTVDIEKLADVVNRTTLEPGEQVVIVDRTGTVLFHSDPAVAELRPNWADRQPVFNALRGRTGRFNYSAEGRPLVGATRPIDGARWVVLVQQNLFDARRPIVRTTQSAGVVVVFVALAAIFGALLFARTLSEPIQHLSHIAEQVEAGDYPSDTPHYPHRELNDLADSLQHMASAVRARESDLATSKAELEAANAQLAQTVAERERALARLSAMSAELTRTEERERRRLAEELHDRVSQVLAVARMRLGLAVSSGRVDPDNLDAAQRHLAEAIRETRAITSELAPPVLFEIGLGAAVGDLCESLQATHGIRIECRTEISESGLDDEAKMVLLRASRELIMNVIKHAGTDAAWVELSGDDSTVTLTVRDEGGGFDADVRDATQGFGLFSIRERLLHLNGTLTTESSPGQGTAVTVRVPRSGDRS